MSTYIPPTELQQAIAKGWSDGEIERRLHYPPRLILSARVWLDELVAEDPPFVVEPPSAVQRQRRRAEAEAAKELVRRRLLADLEQERRIVAGNAWASPERCYERAAHAAWKRQYRARKAAA